MSGLEVITMGRVSADIYPEPAAAAAALRGLGITLAVVKQGPRGVLAADDAGLVQVPPVPVQVVNGLGAGDASGGALCHGLLRGWETRRTIASPTPPARSWPASSPAPMRCRASTRCSASSGKRAMTDDTIGRILSVRGMIIGRGLLYPPDGDVASVADRTAGLL